MSQKKTKNGRFVFLDFLCFKLKIIPLSGSVIVTLFSI